MRLLLLYSFLVLPILGLAKEKVYKDKATFRINREVYFESDVKVIKEQLSGLDCIFGGSFLLDFLKTKRTSHFKSHSDKKLYK